MQNDLGTSIKKMKSDHKGESQKYYVFLSSVMNQKSSIICQHIMIEL